MCLVIFIVLKRRPLEQVVKVGLTVSYMSSCHRTFENASSPDAAATRPALERELLILISIRLMSLSVRIALSQV